MKIRRACTIEFHNISQTCHYGCFFGFHVFNEFPVQKTPIHAKCVIGLWSEILDQTTMARMILELESDTCAWGSRLKSYSLNIYQESSIEQLWCKKLNTYSTFFEKIHQNILNYTFCVKNAKGISNEVDNRPI